MLGPVNTYPDIFESAALSLRIQTFPRPHLAQINPNSLLNSPDACGRKPYPGRKSCGFKNIRIRVDGAFDFDQVVFH